MRLPVTAILLLVLSDVPADAQWWPRGSPSFMTSCGDVCVCGTEEQKRQYEAVYNERCLPAASTCAAGQHEDQNSRCVRDGFFSCFDETYSPTCPSGTMCSSDGRMCLGETVACFAGGSAGQGECFGLYRSESEVPKYVQFYCIKTYDSANCYKNTEASIAGKERADMNRGSDYGVPNAVGDVYYGKSTAKNAWDNVLKNLGVESNRQEAEATKPKLKLLTAPPDKSWLQRLRDGAVNMYSGKKQEPAPPRDDGKSVFVKPLKTPPYTGFLPPDEEIKRWPGR